MSAPDPAARAEECLAAVEARVKAMRRAVVCLRAETSHAQQAAHACDLVEHARGCVADLFGVATAAAAALHRAQESP